ncbi:MAG: hypothetical protein WBX20_03115, partial [Terrimicrobiaceae bacterium]
MIETMTDYHHDLSGLRASGQLDESSFAQGLAFSVQPKRVFASSSQPPFTVKFQNPPGTDASIPFDHTMNGDQITIQIPDTLVANFSFAATITVAPNNNLAQWTAAPPGAGKVVVYPANQTQLEAGEAVEVQFSSLEYAQTPTSGIAIPIETKIYISKDNKQGSTSLDGVSIVSSEPGLIAWADPPVIGKNPSPLPVLHWSTNGGTTLQVWPFAVDKTNPRYYKNFDVSTVNHTVVNPPDAGQQPSYDLQLYAGNSPIEGAKDSVRFFFNPPVISAFGFLRNGSIVKRVELTLGEKVTLKWLVNFVDGMEGVTLLAGSAHTTYPPTSFRIEGYDPAANNQLQSNKDTIKLTLSAPGFGSTATDEATVTYRPVKLLYFKFKDPQLTAKISATDPPNLPVSFTAAPGDAAVTMATLNGPGGPYIQYLGAGDEKYLEIRYFSASKATVRSDEKFTLEWITHQAESLELVAPASGSGHFSIDKSNFAKGTSPEISITETTTFILRATGLN